MFTFTYKNNGTEVTKTFANNLDLIEFVAIKRIKDEDFVSMKMDNGVEIDGGINGLALYALNHVYEAREAMRRAEEACNEDDEFEDDEEDFVEEDDTKSVADELYEMIDELVLVDDAEEIRSAIDCAYDNNEITNADYIGLRDYLNECVGSIEEDEDCNNDEPHSLDEAVQDFEDWMARHSAPLFD